MTDWWLESVARHQVRTSTLDSTRRFASYLVDDLGTHGVVDVGPETLTQWQSKLLDKFAPYTVLNCRKVCRQAFAEAVKFGLIPAKPFDLVKAPRATRVKAGRALSPADAKALITASQDLRLGAAVTLLFCQGWRVSEVLGLAWDDLDLDVGTAQIRRGASYTPSAGMVLGSTKTSGAEGIHHLAPVSVAHLRKRRDEQRLEREAMVPTASPATAGAGPSSPPSTQTAGSISPMLPAMSATRIRRRPLGTSAASVSAPRIPPLALLSFSIRRSDIGARRDMFDVIIERVAATHIRKLLA